MDFLDKNLSQFLEGTDNIVDFFLVVGVPNKYIQGNIEEVSELKPEVLSQFPRWSPNMDLPDSIPTFCFPWGAQVHRGSSNVVSGIFNQILTDEHGKLIYLTCLKTYEDIEERRSFDTKLSLNTSSPKKLSSINFPSSQSPLKSSPDSGEIIKAFKRTATGPAQLKKHSSFTLNSQKTLLPKCLVLVSRVPFMQTFQGILSNLFHMTSRKLRYPIECYISHLVLQVPMPLQGKCSVLYNLENVPYHFEYPKLNQLPLLDINLGILFRSLDVENILYLFRNITLEYPVIFMSTNEKKLTSCSFGMLSLVFPFRWSLVYVPLLPEELLDYVTSPVNFIFGVHSKYKAEVLQMCPENACVVDLDKNIIECLNSNIKVSAFKAEEDCELPCLPPHYSKKLLKKLNKILLDCGALKSKSLILPEAELDLESTTAIREAFFEFFVGILKRFKCFLIHEKDSEERGVFNKRGFLTLSPKSDRKYLRLLLRTQMFANFCEANISPKNNQERLEVLFFTEKIHAKLNRSKLKMTKTPTPFLNSAKTQEVESYQVPLIEEVFENKKIPFTYSNFPNFSYSILAEYGVPSVKPPNFTSEYEVTISPPRTKSYTEKWSEDITYYTGDTVWRLDIQNDTLKVPVEDSFDKSYSSESSCIDEEETMHLTTENKESQTDLTMQQLEIILNSLNNT